MSYTAAQGDTPKSVVTALRAAMADRLLLGLAVLALMRAGVACAEDPAAQAQPEHDVAPRTSFKGATLPEFTKHYTLTDPLLTAPSQYRLSTVPETLETKSYSATEFRPRGRSIFDADPRLSPPGGTVAADKNFLQRLNEYRSHDRVRVLTLWDTGASAISIQTDHKGDPSLQWTSHLFNRGGATQGLLDHLFPVSVFGGTTHITRSATSQPSRVSGALSALHFGSSAPPP
jgi:hypothetical protein